MPADRPALAYRNTALVPLPGRGTPTAESGGGTDFSSVRNPTERLGRTDHTGRPGRVVQPRPWNTSSHWVDILKSTGRGDAVGDRYMRAP